MISKKLMLLILLLVVFLLTACYSINNLPKGEFIKSYDSLNKEYTLNTYLTNGGATVDFGIRGELVNNKTGKQKNIFWDYHVNTAKVEWLNEKSVKINDTINEDVTKDVYDFRRDPNWDQDKNYEKYYE